MESEGDRRPTPYRLELLKRAAEAHIEYARAAAEVGFGVVVLLLGRSAASLAVRYFDISAELQE